MIETVSFEIGLAKIVDAIVHPKITPFLVTLQGYPNSGKTHLRKEIINTCAQRSIYGGGGMIDDYSIKRTLPIDIPITFYLFEDGPDSTVSQHFLLENFGRDADLRVLIARHFTLSAYSHYVAQDIKNEKYGLIIENPAATDKGQS